MPFFKTDDLQLWTQGKWSNLNSKIDIQGFSTDSRNINKNYAFVAIKAQRDGHDFIEDAIKNGAVAIISEKDLSLEHPTLKVEDTLKALQAIAKMHRLRFEDPVIAITGSCGKTSTREMLAKIISWKSPLVNEHNYNNEIGVALTLTRLDYRKNHSAIIEAGVAAPNQMEELTDMIDPDLAIITNVGLSHLEKFMDIANVAKEKAKLAANISEDGWVLMHHNLLSWKSFDELKCKKAIVAPMSAPEINADLVIRYTITNKDNDMVGLDLFIEDGNEYYFEMPDMTNGMIENAILAISAGLILGSKEEVIASQLPKISPLPLRGSILKTNNTNFYVDCYNASPTSMKDALSYFKKISKQNILFVLGDMAQLGLSSHRHHKEIGLNLEHRDSDKVVLVGQNASIYESGLLENGWQKEQISIFECAKEAKDILKNFQGDIFVKASRVCQLENALPKEICESLEIKYQEEITQEEETLDDVQDDDTQAQEEIQDSHEDTEFDDDEFDDDEEEDCEEEKI